MADEEVVGVREVLELDKQVALLAQFVETISKDIEQLNENVGALAVTSEINHLALRKILIGENGTNGLNGRVHDIEVSLNNSTLIKVEETKGRWSYSNALLAGAVVIGSGAVTVLGNIALWAIS